MSHDYCKDMVKDPSFKNKAICLYQAVTGESASVEQSNARIKQQRAIDAQLKEERARMADSARVANLRKGLDTGFLRIGAKLDVEN